MFSNNKITLFECIIFLGFTFFIYNHSLSRSLRHFQSPKIWSLLFIFFVSIIIIYFSPNDNDYSASAHFVGGGDNIINLNGTQNKTAGNFIVELLLNPSQPTVGKETTFQTEVKSTQNDELIELPVSFYILKDGKPVFSNPNNFTLVRQGHYDFNYTFSEPGKYMLFVDIKDIFYTLEVVNLMFEVDVTGPVIDRIINLLKVFLMNYYYVFIFLIALIGISFLAKSSRSKDLTEVGK